MISTLNPLQIAAVKLCNRVLSDYPMAREQLAAHAGKSVAVSVGPFECRFRLTAEGLTELIGEGADEAPAVSFQVSLAALPGLLQKDETAFSQVTLSGDSELASLMSTLARNMKWDIEEDLSKLLGDIAAHRIVDTARRTHQWRQDATQRFTENVAEYLTEERRAFITRHDLETFSRANEALRDDVARLEARLNILKS